MNSWTDARNVLPPDDDRKEKELSDGCKHEASEQIEREVFGAAGVNFHVWRQNADNREEREIC